ncbi:MULTISPECIES: SpoVR family protein [unclassified Roseitalea]|uniref:SpoVR family protein n=1 Tax=unclassified Roseitalea TaxID=2639107 RepID=UPI00273FB6C0|nr:MULTISPECIES: SpoVR family protein [unclassified Roseitalea]
MAEGRKSRSLLFEGAEWTFDDLSRVHDAIEKVARKDLALDLYPNQIEIISSEQMLDAYSSIGMPLMYRHWSFGKHFIQHERAYRRGARGLAYEIVINSNPCISYCLEENTMALQALVIAHAGFGHNHFFKNNELFRQWTDPDGILDYLEYARDFMQRCEERHGRIEVERLLDSAHALMPSSVFRSRRPPPPTPRQAEARQQARRNEAERSAHYLWDRLPASQPASDADQIRQRKRAMHLPEENLLYFIERYSPILQPWQREALAIVRTIGQYFYPQKQTQIMNEGCACFVHYHVMHALHAKGRIDDGAMLEILHNHTEVVRQPDFDDPHFGGLNPYTLGFTMMQDIRRICEAPTEEDRQWFPDFAGSGDWHGVLKDAWANYRDESFILQFLSPEVMRRLRLFALTDDTNAPFYTVSAIHNERGYRQVREALARSRDISLLEPNIQIVDVDLQGDRVLHLCHLQQDGVPLDKRSETMTLEHMRRLWGYPVEMTRS